MRACSVRIFVFMGCLRLSLKGGARYERFFLVAGDGMGAIIRSMPTTFYIPHNVPSSKNGKIKTRWGLITSEATRDWVKKTQNYFTHYRADFLKALEGKEKPYRISFRFVRATQHAFDYVNALQTIQDMMTGGFKKNKLEDTTHRKWIDDDNADVLLPVLEPYEYKKNDGGVYITILD